MNQKSYHFIGIGGIGMSGLARILLEQGKQVSGSDLSSNYVTESLSQAGAHISIGHAANQIEGAGTVIYNTDIPEDNPELVEARKKDCRLLHRADFLSELMKERQVLAVTGTHGKTTTTALLTYVFHVAGLRPAFAVGGMMHNLKSNATDGGGEYFIIEADESDGTFLKYAYNAAIITNIDTDHLSYFGSWEALVGAFEAFINRSQDPELLFYCGDDAALAPLCKQGISYGFGEDCQWKASNFRQKGWSVFFDIHFCEKVFSDVEVHLTGKHNALNALAVFGLSYKLGIDEAIIRKALAGFKGVKRRLEVKGETKDILVIDDYAHHPTEIAATLKALRQAVDSRRIVAVFQPHRYSRMRFLLNDFIHVFDQADIVIVTDLYTANEAPVPLVTTEIIIKNIQEHHKTPIIYLPRETLVQDLRVYLKPHDVVATLGAGDITSIGQELLSSLTYG